MSTVYQDFILMLQPISSHPKAIWYRSAQPIPWPEARDRIIATGATRGFQIGGHGEGKYMISVDSREIDLYRRAGKKPVLLRKKRPSHARTR